MSREMMKMLDMLVPLKPEDKIIRKLMEMRKSAVVAVFRILLDKDLLSFHAAEIFSRLTYPSDSMAEREMEEGMDEEEERIVEMEQEMVENPEQEMVENPEQEMVENPEEDMEEDNDEIKDLIAQLMDTSYYQW